MVDYDTLILHALSSDDNFPGVVELLEVADQITDSGIVFLAINQLEYVTEFINDAQR